MKEATKMKLRKFEYVCIVAIVFFIGFITWNVYEYEAVEARGQVVDVFVTDRDGTTILFNGKVNTPVHTSGLNFQYFVKTGDDLIECNFNADVQEFFDNQDVTVQYGIYPTGERECINLIN